MQIVVLVLLLLVLSAEEIDEFLFERSTPIFLLFIVGEELDLNDRLFYCKLLGHFFLRILFCLRFMLMR